jgi:hypothetical protein
MATITAITPPDRNGLATDLLPMFKTHVRVEFDRDDDYLKLCLVRALDFFERTTEFRVFVAQYAWTPEPFTAGGDPVPFPIQPISEWAAQTAGGTDTSTHYRFIGTMDIDNQTVPQLLQLLKGEEMTEGENITFAVGFADKDSIPPGVVDVGFRIGAHLYENREITSLTGVDQMNPGYFNSLLSGFWRPKA